MWLNNGNKNKREREKWDPGSSCLTNILHCETRAAPTTVWLGDDTLGRKLGQNHWAHLGMTTSRSCKPKPNYLTPRSLL